ncbi:HAMP domain-containing histidine kinase [bacterium]|nr:HAMP domain-containing histidine kinase [bacterium]
MKWHHRLGLLYGVLVTLIVAMGAWWMFYINREGGNYERYQLQRFANDRLHAAFLLRLDPETAHDPEAFLGSEYPHLHFQRIDGGWDVHVDAAALAAVRDEARRRKLMFLSEGLFFLALLIAGTTILSLAFRREREFKRARELFLAGATHELKTPLSCIRLYAETLERPDLDEAERRRIHASLLQDVERLEEMMEQTLSVSRDELGPGRRREVLDLAAETRDLLADMAVFLESKGACVETDLPPGHLVLGDRPSLRVVLRNLLQNAVHHGAGPAEIVVRLAREADRHVLTVLDRGPGIPRRDRKRIFDSFYSSRAGGEDDPVRGTGLGLYLARRNTEALGGKLKLENVEGFGAVFAMTLPVHEEEEA